MESMKDFEKELEHSFRKIKEGDVLKGTIIAINEEAVILDLNYYAAGIIKAENLSNDPNFVADEELQIGDEIEATVVRTDDGHGNIELSKKEANDLLSWDVLKTMRDEETIVNVQIKEVVKAGVVAYVEGIRGFIPASQISADYVEDLEAWLGKKIDVRVITVDESAKKLVLSGKVVAREREVEAHNHKVSMLIPGSVVEGTVESIMPYGAFIALGDGLSGLVHVSQICQKRIKSPNEVLKVGQKVKAKILNTNDNKISLSMKALEELEVEADEVHEAVEYSSDETATTSLAGLLAGLKFDN